MRFSGIGNNTIVIGAESMGVNELLASSNSAVVALAFGGGLLPGLTLANQKAYAALTTARPELVKITRGAAAGSSQLGCSPFLAYPAPVFLIDVVNVLGRIEQASDLDCVANCAAGRYVRREEFEASLASLPLPAEQLCDSSGKALVLATSEAGPPEPLAVDAVWAALSGGAPYVSPQEVERCLARWRPNPATLALDDFERSLLQGRAIVACGFVVLFGMEALVLVLLVLRPLIEKLSA